MQFGFFTYFIFFWIFLISINWFLKFSTWYQELIDKYGISVSYIHISCFSTYFNRIFFKLGNRHPTITRGWFSLGVVCSIILIFLSIILLISILANTFLKPFSKQQQILTPIMPGINLPNNQLGYFFCSLLISAIFHELAHALAAVGEEVRVNGCGVFLMLMYPGAYVDLDSSQVEALSPFKQLRIYCAGVWHNVVIVFSSFLLLLSLPSLLQPLYSHRHHATVTYVKQTSVISGGDGIETGDRLEWVGDCRVRGSSDWVECIQATLIQPNQGFCTYKKHLPPSSNRTKVADEDCCTDTPPSNLCFFLATKEQIFDHYCLVVRSLIHNDKCHQDVDCSRHQVRPHKTQSAPYINTSQDFDFFERQNRLVKRQFLKVSEGSFEHHLKLTGGKNSGGFNLEKGQDDGDDGGGDGVCVRPSIANFTRLIVISFVNHHKKPLIFLGHPYDLIYSVTVSSYSPKYSFLPLNPPSIIQHLLRYLISLSGALAVVNVVPCYALDGQWIIKALYNSFLPSILRNSHYRDIVYTVTISLGSLLLIVNVLIALTTLLL